MRFSLRCAVSAVVLLVPSWAQETEAFQPVEDGALALKERGQFVAALDELVRGLDAAPLDDERSRAVAEFMATGAASLARATGRWSTLRPALARLRTRAGEHVALRQALAVLDLEGALATGDRATLGSATTDLGLLTAWWIVGPFDNERGGGFARALPPEQKLELDAAYEGKKREVRWRTLPVAAPPGGIVDLDALVRPNDQVLCYALTLVHSDRPQTAALRLGSDEAIKVFHDGVDVLARDVRRTFAHDQDAVALRLRQGANLVMLKVCELDGDFQFAARLTRLDGGPLDGVRFDYTEAQLRAAAGQWNDAKTQRAGPSETVDRGAVTFFERSLAQGASGVDAFRLATLLAYRHPDDPNERRDFALAEQAVAAMPQSSSARMLLAHTRRRPVQHEAEKEESARRFDYEAILAAQPEHPRALYELAVMDLDSIGASEHAEAALRTALRTNPDFAQAHFELARALRLRKLDVLADRELELAARAPGGGTAEIQAQLADMHRRRGAGDSQIAALRRARETDADQPSRTTALADALLRAGRRDEAAALLVEGTEALPFARSVFMDLARLQRAERRIDDAVATLGRWLEVCPEDDEAVVEMARLHGLGGRQDQQRELLRLALDLNKNLRNERRYLDFLEAEDRPFYDAWRVDGEQVLSRDQGPPADAESKSDPVHVLLEQTVVHAYRNGTTSRYSHRVVRVLNDEGAQQMARHFVPHYFGEQRARLLTARVFKKGGEVVRPKLREYFVALPSLEAGDVVDLEERVDDLAPSFFGDYFGYEFTFARGSPTARSELVAVLDPGRQYRVQVRNGAPEPVRERLDDGSEVWRLTMLDLPRMEFEEYQPGWEELAPIARISTYADWDGFASWWWNLIRKQMEMTPAMRDKVAELTKDASTALAKIDALYRFVTTDVRYTAWEFGVHGYKPYSTPAIFERRHGDCKDKALLLNTLLAEVGIEAYPVLIHADVPHGADDLTLPLVQHFNHCISYLPAQSGLPEMFLDGTATYHPLDTLPEMDHGARVLVVRAGRADLRDVPWPEAQNNVDGEAFAIELQPSGDATVRLTRTPRLNHAVSVREELGNEPAKRKEKLERSLSAMLGKVQIQKVETSDLLDLDAPVEVVVDLTVQDFAAKQESGLVLKGCLDPTDLSSMTSKTERTFPLLRGSPESWNTVLRYKLPPGYAPTALPEAVRVQTRFGTYEMVWTHDGNELRVERQLAFAQNRIEPAEYPQFREFATSVQRADSQVVVVKPNGGGK
ncbi:MAG: DUF3857 domain-containing protein [Planctomycetota bacterium]